MIAALFVDPRGAYANLPGVDPWDEKRDARNYAGPWPVVAHPPCQRWCRLAGFVEARWGYKRGDDGGTFLAALNAVRTWGGVLEHPAYSKAWDAFALPKPARRSIGWTAPDAHGGRSCYVEQQAYGHAAKKATWLYACGVALPALRWQYTHDKDAVQNVSWCGPLRKPGDDRVSVSNGRKRMGAHTIDTPIEFRDVLLSMARSRFVLPSQG